MYIKQNHYTLIVSEDEQGFTALELMDKDWGHACAWYRDDNLSPGENHLQRQTFFHNLYYRQLPPICLLQNEDSEVTVVKLLTRAGMTLDENNFIHSYSEPIKETVAENLFEETEEENTSNWNVDMDLVDKLLSDGYAIRVEDNKIIVEGKF